MMPTGNFITRYLDLLKPDVAQKISEKAKSVAALLKDEKDIEHFGILLLKQARILDLHNHPNNSLKLSSLDDWLQGLQSHPADLQKKIRFEFFEAEKEAKAEGYIFKNVKRGEWRVFAQTLIDPSLHRGELRDPRRGAGYVSRLTKSGEYEVVANKQMSPSRTPLHDKATKKSHTRFTSSTYAVAGYKPTPFGLEDSTVGVYMGVEDAIYQRMMIYKDATFRRPYQGSTKKEAEEFLDKKRGSLDYLTSLAEMREVGAARRHPLNEVMIGIKWSKTCGVICFKGDELSSRLEAQLRAADLQYRFALSGQHFNIPIKLYPTGNEYTAEMQQADLRLAVNTPLAKTIQYFKEGGSIDEDIRSQLSQFSRTEAAEFKDKIALNRQDLVLKFEQNMQQDHLSDAVANYYDMVKRHYVREAEEAKTVLITHWEKQIEHGVKYDFMLAHQAVKSVTQIDKHKAQQLAAYVESKAPTKEKIENMLSVALFEQNIPKYIAQYANYIEFAKTHLPYVRDLELEKDAIKNIYQQIENLLSSILSPTINAKEAALAKQELKDILNSLKDNKDILLDEYHAIYKKLEGVSEKWVEKLSILPQFKDMSLEHKYFPQFRDLKGAIQSQDFAGFLEKLEKMDAGFVNRTLHKTPFDLFKKSVTALREDADLPPAREVLKNR